MTPGSPSLDLFYVKTVPTAEGRPLRWGFLGDPTPFIKVVKISESAAHPVNRTGRGGVLVYRGRDDSMDFDPPLFKPVTKDTWDPTFHGPIAMVTSGIHGARALPGAVSVDLITVLVLKPGDVFLIPADAQRDLAGIEGELCGLDGQGFGLWVPNHEAAAKDLAVVVGSRGDLIALHFVGGHRQ